MTRLLIISCVFVASLLFVSLGSAKERSVKFINTEILSKLQSKGDPETCLGYKKDKAISPKTQSCSDEMLCGTLLASPEGMDWFGLRKIPNIRLNSWRQEFRRGDGRFAIRSIGARPKLIPTKRWRDEAQKRGLDPNSCLTFLADAYVKAGGVIENDDTNKTSPPLRRCTGKRYNFDQCVEIFVNYYPNCQRTVFYNDGLISKTAWTPKGCHKKRLKPKYSKTTLETLFSQLRLNQRSVVQTNLASIGYYKFRIDGIYGKGTAAALKAYNRKYMKNADLTKSANVTALLEDLLKEKPANEGAEPELTVTLNLGSSSPKVELDPGEAPEPKETEGPPHIDFAKVKASYDAGDFSKAFEDAQTLAVEGNGEAQLYLGKMYADGRGTLQVTTSAHMWFNIASMNGSDEAFEERKAIATQMTPELINEAQKMAVACIKSDYRECGIKVKPDEQKITGEKVVATASNMKSHFKEQTMLRRKQLQYALKDMGLYSSSIDGVYGRRTEQAFMNFQNIQDAEDQSAEALFQLVLRKVDVPTSFAPPKRQKVVVKKEEPSKPKYVAAMGYSPYGNTTMPVQQAIDVCKSGADKAFDSASDNARYQSNSYSGRCNRYGSYSNCTVQEDSPYGSDIGTALAIGMMEGISRGLAGRAAREKEMKSCMAHYGWRKN